MRTIVLIFLGMLGISACGSEDSLCGVDKEWDGNFDIEYTYQSLDALTGNRIFQFEDASSPEDICTEEHANVEYYVDFKGTKPAALRVFGKAYWGFFEKQTELSEFDNYTDLGLKQAFNGEPGWVGLQIIVEFPTQGSLDNDIKYVKDHIERCDIRLKYKQHI